MAVPEKKSGRFLLLRKSCRVTPTLYDKDEATNEIASVGNITLYTSRRAKQCPPGECSKDTISSARNTSIFHSIRRIYTTQQLSQNKVVSELRRHRRLSCFLMDLCLSSFVQRCQTDKLGMVLLVRSPQKNHQKTIAFFLSKGHEADKCS